jgi:hypothetical protein
MFEKLESVGEAFRNYFKKDKEEDKRNTVEKVYEFEEAKEKYKPTEQQQKVGQTEDYGTESIKEILKTESAKKEEEGKSKDLDEKLSDIEKVLEKFSEQTPLGSGSQMPFEATTTIDLNRPIDFRKETAKEYVSPVISQPTSQDDRIKLLYANLRKQGLI